MEAIQSLGQWPLIVAVGCLWVLHFISESRIKRLERKAADDCKQCAGSAEQLEEELEGAFGYGKVEPSAPAQHVPIEPGSRID